MKETTDQAVFRRALNRLPRFLYGNALRLVMVSVAWAICSLPMVTVGPATLSAYTAIQDLRSDRNTIDRSRIVSVLRQNGVASVVFSGIPVVFAMVAFLYGVPALAQESLVGEVVALMAAYIAIYTALVAVPTYTAMARGTPPVAAVRQGIRWVGAHPTAALTTGLLTVVVLALTVLLTIGFVLLFAGLAFSIHITVVEELDMVSTDGTPTQTLTIP